LGTICIVDDDEAVRDSLRVLLESHRMDVREFDSGNALLASDDFNSFDCFVLDFQMPGMNGLELAEALRTKGVGAAAILVSALRIAASDDRMRRAGVVASLMKPVAEGDLIGCIQQAMEPQTRQ
jgi:two-component system response regulator FixJ